MSLNANRTSSIFTVGANSAQDFDQIHRDWFATRFNQSMNSNLDLVRVGINYRFGAAPVVAKY